MQDQKTRAAAVLKLVQLAIAADDQECFEFLSQTIEREHLYRYYQADDGTPIKNMASVRVTTDRRSSRELMKRRFR